MYSEKDRAALEATAKSGKDAERLLAQDDADQRSALTRDLDAFEAMGSAARVQLYHDNPEKWRALSKQMTDKYEQALTEDPEKKLARLFRSKENR
jgi:hypothetical protein